MTVTTDQSTQYAASEAKPNTFVATHDWHGRMRIAFFNFTQGATEGEAGSLAYLCKLPAGKVRIILPLSRLAFSAMATGRTMDLGWLAYVNLDGVDVVADPNGLDDGVDVSSAGSLNPGGTIGAHETKLFESQGGVTITAQINDAAIGVGETIDGYFVYVLD